MSRTRFAIVALALALLAGACSAASDDGAIDDLEDPGACTVVDLAVSPEK